MMAPRVAKAIADYEAGRPMPDILAEARCSRQALYNWLDAHGVKRRGRMVVDAKRDAEDRAIVDACRKDVSLNEAARLMGLSPARVRRAFKRTGAKPPAKPSRWTPEIIAEIRAKHEAGAIQADLAKAYGTHQPIISHLLSR